LSLLVEKRWSLGLGMGWEAVGNQAVCPDSG